MRRSDDSHAVVHTEPSRRFARGRAHRAIATIRTRSCTLSHRDDSHAVVHFTRQAFFSARHRSMESIRSIDDVHAYVHCGMPLARTLSTSGDVLTGHFCDFRTRTPSAPKRGHGLTQRFEA
jgi:hypothetical protein